LILFYTLIAVMPLERHPLWAGYMGDLTLVKYLGGACLLYSLAHLLIRSSIPSFFSTWTSRLFAIFMAIVTLSYARYGSLEGWQFSPLLSCVSFALLYLITLTVLDSVARLRHTFMVAMGSVGVASLYVIRDWQKYHGYYAGYRPSGAAGDPNYFSLAAVFCIPLGLYLAFERPSIWQRLFCLGCLSLIAIAVTLGASRGGLLGLLAVFLVVAFRSKRRRIALVTALLLVPNLLLPNSPVQRLLVPSSGDTRNADARTQVWMAGLRMIGQNPLAGVGLGRFKPQVANYQRSDQLVESLAHNTYIEVAAELGIPAFFVWALMYFSAFRLLKRVRRRARLARVSLLEPAALALEAGLVGASTCVFFISAEYEKVMWLFLFLPIALHSISLKCPARLHRPAAPLAGEDDAFGGPNGTVDEYFA
jgi:O-antigen ligase